MYRLSPLSRKSAIPPIYLSNLFLGLHYFLTLYVNSSFLGQHLDNSWLNFAFAAGALLNIILLILAPKILHRLSIKGLTLMLAIGEFLAVYLLSILESPTAIFATFVFHQALAPLILYCLDLFLEGEIKDENTTGKSRSFFLTIQNVALIISLLAVSRFVTATNFSTAYVLSALALLPLIGIVIFGLKNINYKNGILEIKRSIAFLKRDKDVMRIILSGFLLQFFYAWMVIYLPLSLAINLHFEWSVIGTLLLVMILPFVIVEIPAGFLADKKFGEKEMLILGFIITGVFTFFIPFLHSPVFLTWAAVLFMTRVGASLIEIGSETYFFKKVKESDSYIISLFRITRPLSFILAPLIAAPILMHVSYQSSFLFLAIIITLGAFFVPKVDTK